MAARQTFPIILTFLLGTIQIPAQVFNSDADRPDSLRRIIADPAAKVDDRIYSLYMLAESFDPSNPDSMMYYARQVRSEAERTGNNSGMVYFYWLEGYHLQYQGKWKEALASHMNAMGLAEKGDPHLLINANTNVGNNYMNLMILDKALVYHNKAYELARAAKDSPEEITAMINLAIVYQLSGNLDKSIELNKQILNLIDSTHAVDLTGKAAVLHNLAKALNDKGSASEALPYLFQAYQINKSENNRYYLKQNLQVLANIFGNDTVNQFAKVIHDKRSSNDIALYYLNEMKQISLEDKDTSSLVDAYSAISNILVNKGDLQGALKELNEGIKWIGHNENAEAPLLYNDGFANIYFRLGDYKMAAEYYRKRIACSDSLDKVKIAEKVSQLSESYEIKNRDEQLQQKERQLTDKVSINHMFIALSSLIFLIAAILLFSFIMKQRAAKELKRKNIEVEEARARAERNEKFKEQFLANMSHEIRTPLNSVIGMTDLMLDDPQAPKNENFLRKIKQAGEHLLVIINDILDLSKVSAGKIELVPKPFSPEEFLAEIREMFQLKSREKDLVLVTQVESGTPDLISADPERLRQVIINLVGNAIKFTEKGSVTIKVSSIEINDKNCLLRLSVTDTGRGISKEKQAVIFDDFVQLYNQVGIRNAGTGLGLAISKKLVELMGGDLKVESQPGIGSVFYFSVPVKLVSEPEFLEFKLEQNAPIGSRKGAFHILLVEDNPANQLVTEGHLEKLLPESNVFSAKDGFEALKIIKKEKIDLVLMDIQMPGMDGYETTRKIRELNGDSSRVPVIALTASVIQSDIQRCMQAGMNTYVPKPIDRALLSRAIFEQLKIENGEPAEVLESKALAANGDLPDKPEWVQVLYKNCDFKKTRFIRYLDLSMYEMNYELNEWEYYITRKQNKKIASSVHKLLPQIKIFTGEDVFQSAITTEAKLRAGWSDDCVEPLKQLREALYKTREEAQALLKTLDT